jgi:NADH:ubiquinone oxidoreductase subunit 6 (subunit J)
MGEQITFAIACIGAVGFGIGVVFFKDAFRAAVSLIGTLLSVALLFIVLLAPFVAALQVIVYAGAIVVMFLFVIAYLGDRPVSPGTDRMDAVLPFAWLALAGVAAFGAITVLASTIGPATTPENSDVGSPASIGHAFLDQHIIAFEVTSLILLIAAVGAVILAKRAVMLEGGR